MVEHAGQALEFVLHAIFPRVLPQRLAGALTPLGSITLLTLSGDNDTCASPWPTHGADSREPRPVP
jgi:hypothetical protein